MAEVQLVSHKAQLHHTRIRKTYETMLVTPPRSIKKSLSKIGSFYDRYEQQQQKQQKQQVDEGVSVNGAVPKSSLRVGDRSPKSPRSPKSSRRQSSYTQQQCRSPTQSPGGRHSLTQSPGSHSSISSSDRTPASPIQYTYTKETCIKDPRTTLPVPKSSLRISDSTPKQREFKSGSCRLLYSESAEMT